MRTSSDEGVERRMEELELGVSKALGISLSEVRDRYFWDSVMMKIGIQEQA
jgi:hypothetical protein